MSLYITRKNLLEQYACPLYIYSRALTGGICIRANVARMCTRARIAFFGAWFALLWLLSAAASANRGVVKFGRTSAVIDALSRSLSLSLSLSLSPSLSLSLSLSLSRARARLMYLFYDYIHRSRGENISSLITLLHYTQEGIVIISVLFNTHGEREGERCKEKRSIEFLYIGTYISVCVRGLKNCADCWPTPRNLRNCRPVKMSRSFSALACRRSFLLYHVAPRR